MEGQGSRSPLDVLVDAAEATVSVGVRDLCCRLNGNGKSFDRTAENLAKSAQVRMSGELLRQVVEEEGKRALALAKSGELGPDWMAKDCKVLNPQGQEVSRVYLGSDGFFVPLVTMAEKQKRREKTRQNRQKRGRKARPLGAVKKGADGPLEGVQAGGVLRPGDEAPAGERDEGGLSGGGETDEAGRGAAGFLAGG